MSFNWPEIPFTGAEVTAFVNAYKELAESIIDRWEFEIGWDSSADFGNGITHLKAPFTNKRVVKELLTYGLVYASFIIQQRAKSPGPGTDFDLNNSPYKKSLTEEQRIDIIKKLGCVFDSEEMKNAWKKNNGGNPSPFDPAVEDCLSSLLSGEDADGNPHNGTYLLSCNDLTPDDPPCGADPLTTALTGAVARDQGPPPGTSAIAAIIQNWDNASDKGLAFVGGFGDWGADIFIPLKAYISHQYQTGNGSPITNTNIPQYIYNGLKSQIQTTYNQIQQYGLSEFDQNGNQNNNKKNNNGEYYLKEITGLTGQERASYGATSAGDKIYVINFYITQNLYRSYLDNMFGNATIIVDGSGNVKRIRDDFDFEYANKVQRTDGSVAGDAYQNSDVVGGIMYGPHAYDKFGNPIASNSPDVCTPGTSFMGIACRPPSSGLTEDQVRGYYEERGGFTTNYGRIPAIEAKKRGCGKPVPINFDLSSNQSGSFQYPVK